MEFAPRPYEGNIGGEKQYMSLQCNGEAITASKCGYKKTPEPPSSLQALPGSNATSQHVRPDAGLPKRPVFSEKLDTKYVCGLCSMSLRDAMQSYCGHRFCKDCVEKMFGENPAPDCEKCKEEDDGENEFTVIKRENLFPDKAIEREISKLSVSCPEENCNWSGTYKQYSNHWESCDQKTETCPFGCEGTFGKKDLQAHHETSCTAHLAILLQMQKVLRSGKTGTADDVTSGSEVLRSRIRAIETWIAEHGTVKAVDSESGYGSFEKQGSSLNIEQARMMQKLEKSSETYTGLVEVLHQEVERLIGSVTECQRQQTASDGLARTMQQKIKQLERELVLKDLSLKEKDQRLEALKLTSFDGNLVWPIKNYAELKAEAASGGAQSIYSPPFYTSRSGYKLRARIYLNGDGMGKNTHISLFLVLMRGPYDAILQWPFTHRVALKILDQNHREDIVDAFRPDPSSSSFRRPVSDMNIASGCPVFAAHAKVEDKSLGYVKDNTIFVNIIVEPSKSR